MGRKSWKTDVSGHSYSPHRRSDCHLFGCQALPLPVGTSSGHATSQTLLHFWPTKQIIVFVSKTVTHQWTCSFILGGQFLLLLNYLKISHPLVLSSYAYRLQNLLICWGEKNCAHCRMRPHSSYRHRANKHFMIDNCSSQSIWKSFRLNHHSVQMLWK